MSTPTARALRAARLRCGLSQSEAAALVHVGVETFANWETGATRVNLAAAELLAIKLRLPWPLPEPGPDEDLRRQAKPGPKGRSVTPVPRRDEPDRS